MHVWGMDFRLCIPIEPSTSTIPFASWAADTLIFIRNTLACSLVYLVNNTRIKYKQASEVLVLGQNNYSMTVNKNQHVNFLCRLTVFWKPFGNASGRNINIKRVIHPFRKRIIFGHIGAIV